MRRELAVLGVVLAMAALLAAWWQRGTREGVDWSAPMTVDGVGLAFSPEDVKAILGDGHEILRMTQDQPQWLYGGPEGTQVKFVRSPGSPAGLQVVGVLGTRLQQDGRTLVTVDESREQAVERLGGPGEVHPRAEGGVVTGFWFPGRLARLYRSDDSEVGEDCVICNVREDRIFRVGLFSSPRGAGLKRGPRPAPMRQGALGPFLLADPPPKR